MKFPPTPALEICILAGGLSQRMGCDKSRLRLGRHSLLAHIRLEARKLGAPVRVIRRDLVPRCGPLGGIYTALIRAKAEAVLFLACDMPFVTAELLTVVQSEFQREDCALFVRVGGNAGFPFLLRREALTVVNDQMKLKQFSLQALAGALSARCLRLPSRWRAQLANVNTPQDWTRIRHRWAFNCI
ncbi:MAG: molybdenum cofactor guanylyltransferase [Verrucomicrobiae bacterium]|nr:molybdenum cofactor guanylyltransferase [Verrucomicrobiae bacterium]